MCLSHNLHKMDEIESSLQRSLDAADDFPFSLKRKCTMSLDLDSSSAGNKSDSECLGKFLAHYLHLLPLLRLHVNFTWLGILIFEIDETPTPVRLIRNCEEVGLFDDLKHVNPFDETFRQAIYSQKKPTNTATQADESLDMLAHNDEDTLHTPNIIPPTNGVDVSECKTTESKEDSDTNNKQAESGNRTVIVPKQSQHANKTDNKVWRKIYPKPHIVTSIESQPNRSNAIKEHIKDSLMKLRSANDGSTVNSGNSTVISAQMQSSTTKVALTAKPSTVKVSTMLTAASKSFDTNERNREAAKRYRHKQKSQHQHLMQRNAQLEAENAQLRKELQLMKEAHRNCIIPITIQSQSGKR